MSKFKSSVITEVPTGLVPHWPKQCQKCGNKTDVALLTVYDDEGRARRGGFGDFGYVSRTGDWLLNEPFKYANWVTRCADHYGDDM